MRYALCLAMVIVALAGCAPMSRLPAIDQSLAAAERDKQMEMALREQMRRSERLAIVGWRILEANTDACGDKLKPRFGFWAFDESIVPENYRPTWRRVYGTHQRPRVFFTVAGSPAQAAGITSGDLVLSAGGVGTETADGVKQALAKMADATGPLDLVLRRDGAEIKATLAPRTVCDFPVSLVTGDQVNAYANGSKIFVTNGMMRFAATDEELALVVAHELGHNTHKHMDAKMGNRLIGAILGALVSVAVRADVSQIGAEVGQGAFSKEFEAEADYVGTYYAAKAGFNVDRAADFWRRMAVEHPAAIGHGTTHPDTASRFVAIETAVKEVSGKRASGAPLVPEKKP